MSKIKLIGAFETEKLTKKCGNIIVGHRVFHIKVCFFANIYVLVVEKASIIKIGAIGSHGGPLFVQTLLGVAKLLVSPQKDPKFCIQFFSQHIERKSKKFQLFFRAIWL